ncbi:MAG: sugar phosphate isomerase/epimerase family protein [Planctomycetota bacterium]|nr:sugar phosphate isomerase/epimerase family protein [Planctomycetota bacterium]
MLQIKIGIQLNSLRQSFKRSLETAARLGAQAIEIDARHQLKPANLSRTAIRHLRKTLEDLNLTVSAVTFQTRRGYADPDGIERRVEATKSALKMAYDLGTNVVVNQIGRIPDEEQQDQRNLMLATLSDIGHTGQHVGAFLAARTGTEGGQVLRNLIEQLPAGSLAVDFDPGNLIINGFSAGEAVRELGAHVIHVHARDGVQDLAQGRGLEVPLGRGSADFPHLLGVLEEHQYRGFMTIQREHAADPLLETGQAVEFLRNI